MVHKHVFITRLFAVIVCMQVLHIAANPPANLFFDTAILYDVRGVNPWPNHKEDPGLSIDILPFYQHAKGAKNCRGQKVPKGDRTGRLNMIGLLQGREPAPEGTFDAGTPLGDALAEINNQNFGFVTDPCFDGKNLLGRYSVSINYEKFGLRGQARLNLGGGLGISARSGAVCYKQNPCFLDLTLSCLTTQTPTCEMVLPECDNNEKDQPAGFSTELQSVIRDNLTSPQKRCEIANQLCIDLNKVSRVAFEDVHADVHWFGSFALSDRTGGHVVSVIPYIAGGVWIPTGETDDEDILFRLPTGNNGYWGITAEAALNFDFPETLTLGFGGAVSFFPESRTKCLRIPSRGLQGTTNSAIPTQQEVLFPWKVEAERKLGTTWHVHGDLMTRDFIQGLTFYASYIYSKHQQDDIKLPEACACLFAPEKLERQTQWESQMLHFALDYQITRNLYFGFAYQPTLTGRRIYRTSTLIGTIRLYFG